MEPLTADEDGVPQHLQQLQQLVALLQKDKAESDSVTWVPELVPEFIQKAVQTVLSPGGDNKLTDLTASPAIDASQDADVHNQPATHTHSTAYSSGDAAPTAPAATLAVGTQHLRVTNSSSSSSRQSVDWVMTTCLVPDGLPAAAGAEHAGGLAAMEVVCPLLMLWDCQPAEASQAFIKALSKVKWQRYGLQYRDYFSCKDGIGILTLGVLPDAVMVPLSLIVCSCDIIETQGLCDGSAAAPPNSTDGLQADPTNQTQPPSTTGALVRNKRRRGGTSRQQQPKPPSLSMRREVPLWVGAFEEALADLKAQLPGGYLQGKQEAVLATCLPPIAASLANIMMRAAEPQLKQHCCSLLDCQPAELQETLLAQLQALAAEALEQRPAAAAAALQPRVQQQQVQGPEDGPAAAAAQLASESGGAGAGIGGGSGLQQDSQQQQQGGEEKQGELHQKLQQQQGQADCATALQQAQHHHLLPWPPADAGDGDSRWLGPLQQDEWPAVLLAHSGTVAGGSCSVDEPLGSADGWPVEFTEQQQQLSAAGSVLAGQQEPWRLPLQPEGTVGGYHQSLKAHAEDAAAPWTANIAKRPASAAAGGAGLHAHPGSALVLPGLGISGCSTAAVPQGKRRVSGSAAASLF